MTWVKSDDNEPNHPKIFRAGAEGYAFFQAAKCYCSRNLTDGFIPTSDLSLVLPAVTLRTAIKLAVKLVECGLFEVRESGYVVHDYLDYNPSRIEILDSRATKERAGRLGGLQSGVVRRARREANNEADASLPVRSKTNPHSHTHSQEEDQRTTLSRLAPRPLPTQNGNKRPHRGDAEQILAFLNQLTGRSYRAVDTNLKLIEARLASGATVQNCKGVIARKYREWKDDPKMSPYIRPLTIFAASNFENYLGEREGVDGA